MAPPPNAKPEYYPILVAFMSFRDNAVYTKATIFTDVQLDSITPEELVRYFCLKVYGDPDPHENANPTEGRSSSLEHYKKALSFYMPNRLTPWNVMTSTGNPTRSIVVNELIK